MPSLLAGCRWIGVLGMLLITSAVQAQQEWLPEDPSVISTGGWIETPAADYNARANLTHRTAGAGYENAFTDLRLWAPLYNSPDAGSLTFLDTALLLDNSAEVGFNAALGHRLFIDPWYRTVGAYVAYDSRESGIGSVSQLATGFESLGRIELRGNIYIGLEGSSGQANHLYSNPTFVDQYIQLDEQSTFHTTADMWDLEIGGAVPNLEEYLSLYAGAYGISAKNQDDAYGWKVRVETQLGDHSRLWLKVTNDPMFDTNVVFGASFYFPGIFRRNVYGTPDWRALMQEPLIRNEAVVVAETHTRGKIYATNATTGTAQTVAHVDPNASTNGNGTVQSPYNNLAAASLAADPYSIVFVKRRDDATSTNLEGTFFMKEGQRLLGDGVHHTFTATQGTFDLPGYTVGDRPLLTSSDITVKLHDQTEVAGFEFDDIDHDSILGSFVKDVTIRDNKFSHTGSTQVDIVNIAAAGLGGTTHIYDNTFDINTSITTKAINASLVGDTTLLIERNTIDSLITGGGTESIDIQTHGTGSRDIRVLNNQITQVSPNFDGSGLRLLYTGDTTAVIQGNHVTMGHGRYGIHVDGNGDTLDLTVDNNLLEVLPDTATLQTLLHVTQQTSGYSIARVTNNRALIVTAGMVVADGFELNLQSTASADLIFANNHLSLSGAFPLLNGVNMVMTSNANANVNFYGNTLLGTPTHQLHVDMDTGAVLNLRMRNNTITDSSEFSLASGAQLNFEIFNGQTPGTALVGSDFTSQNMMLAPTLNLTSATATRAAPDSLPIPTQ